LASLSSFVSAAGIALIPSNRGPFAKSRGEAEAKRIQLQMEYNAEPPFNAGPPEKRGLGNPRQLDQNASKTSHFGLSSPVFWFVAVLIARSQPVSPQPLTFEVIQRTGEQNETQL
jgi:hypothetical protein